MVLMAPSNNHVSTSMFVLINVGGTCGETNLAAMEPPNEDKWRWILGSMVGRRDGEREGSTTWLTCHVEKV